MIEANKIDELPEGEVNCEQKCQYCKVITHSCHDENCTEPARSVCSNELCQAKMVIEFQQGQIKDMEAIHKDEILTLKEKMSAQVKMLDTYRLLMLKPADMDKLVNDGAMNSHIMKIWCSQNAPFWEKMENDILSEWVEGYHTVYTRLLSIIHAKGLKVEIRKHLVEKTATSQKDATQEKEAKSKASTPAKPKDNTIELIMAKGYSKDDAKAISGNIKTFKWTVDQAVANWEKMNS